MCDPCTLPTCEEGGGNGTSSTVNSATRNRASSNRVSSKEATNAKGRQAEMIHMFHLKYKYLMLGKDNVNLGYVPAASRPYLSESWDDDFDKTSQKMIRIQAFGNGLEIKHQLRFWAHSVDL
ncbi:hypothetical protein Tco_0609146 [Tanacetum coccineum]